MLAGALGAFVLAWVLTEVLKPPKIKPFNCRPCMTFWLISLVCIVLALFIAPDFVARGLTSTRLVPTYGLAGVSFLIAFVAFFYLKGKFKIYR